MTSKKGEINLVYVMLEGQLMFWVQDEWQEGTKCFKGEWCTIENINWPVNKENGNYLASLGTGNRVCLYSVSTPTVMAICDSLLSTSLALESHTKANRLFQGFSFCSSLMYSTLQGILKYSLRWVLELSSWRWVFFTRSVLHFTGSKCVYKPLLPFSLFKSPGDLRELFDRVLFFLPQNTYPETVVSMWSLVVHQMFLFFSNFF